MKRHIGIGLIIAMLGIFACNFISGAVEQLEREAPTPAAPADVVERPAGPATGVDEALGDVGSLTSYRSAAIYTDQQTGRQSEITFAVVLQPFAYHMTIQGDDEDMETIATSEGLWIKAPGIGWYKTDFTPEEIAMTPEEIWEELGELEHLDTPPWPSEIFDGLPDQIMLPLVEGGLTPAGSETVNGISCLKYAVNTYYEYAFDQIAGEDRVQATGFVWVADQADLPAMIIQADIEQIETNVLAGQETVTTTQIEYRATDINAPIAIEPPADAVGLEDLFADEDAFDPGDPVEAADLSELDSYRLVMTIQVQMEGYDETTSSITIEWTREPEAYRHVYDMGGFEVEHLWVGDKVWMRVSGGDWMEIAADEAPDPFNEIANLMDWRDNDMRLAGEAVINGVQCKHYTHEVVTPFATSYLEVWIADQAGIPPVAIRSLTRVEQEGHTNIMEMNLYDINQPFTIESP